MAKKTIEDLRESIFDTIDLLKAGKIDVSQAKAVADLGHVIVDTAKVEIEFADKLGGKGSGFIPIDQPKQLERPKAEYSNKGHLSVAKEHGLIQS